MNIDLTQDDLLLLETLLAKEEGDIKIEILHSRNIDYEQYLKQRKEHIKTLLGKIRDCIPGIIPNPEEVSI